MPIKKRKQKSRAIDQFCIDELKNGPCLISGVGYFSYQDNTSDRDRMYRDWLRVRESMLAEWIQENPGTRPYAWWEFEAPEPRGETESEREFLARLDLLTPEEKT